MTKPGIYKFETLDAAGNVCCGSDRPDDPRCASCQTKPVNGHLRTAVQRDEFTPPDPYAAALAKLREEQGLPPVAPCPFNSPKYDPHGPAPSGYDIAIERLKKENRR